MFKTENKDLLHILQKCGHFLYHRRGISRGQFIILKLLSENDGMTQTKLTQLLTLKSGSVSETVKKLETKGFITRRRSEADKRVMMLEITDEGRSFMQSQRRIWQAQEDIMFSGLTETEQEQLTYLLEKLLADWEAKFDESLFHCRRGKNE